MVYRTGVFPVRLESKQAVGNWIPVGHSAKKHPIFEGLPVNCLMGQDYQDVCAVETIMGLEGETVAASLSLNIRRPEIGSVWWGSDLAIVPYGKGKIVFSTLQIIENLGKDPVADKLLYNMIRFAAMLSNPSKQNAGELEREVERYMEKFENATNKLN